MNGLRGPRRSPFPGLASDDNGVTPVIGTILILAVTVAGIGVTLLLGAPVIQRLQDQAALENMAAQFAEVRAEAGRLTAGGGSVAPGLNLAGGKVTLVHGTQFMFTLSQDPSFPDCDLRLFSWHDGDGILNFTYTGFPAVAANCRFPAKEGPLIGTTIDPPIGPPIVIDDLDTCNHPNYGCFEAYRLPNLVANLAATLPADCVPVVGHLAPGAPCNVGIIPLLGATIGPHDEFLFRMTDGTPNPTIYWQAWLLNTDRLEWGRGGVSALYEAGALFTKGNGAIHLEGVPDIQEGIANETAPVRITLPTWKDSAGTTVTGSGLHALRLTYDNGQALTFAADSYQLRYDFRGDLARSWCNALFLRNSSPIIIGDPYVEAPDIAQPPLRAAARDLGHQCNAPSPNADGIKGIVFNPDDPAPPATFPVTLSRQVLHARLDP